MIGSRSNAAIAFLSAWLVAGSLAVPIRSAAAEGTGTAIRAADFIDFLGVNVHVEYTDGKYRNIDQVIACLAYLGIAHVRDATLDRRKRGQQNYGKLADAGVKLDLFVSGRPIEETISLLRDFAQDHPGAISAVEGPNEVNNFPLEYRGESGATAATALQDDLYAAVRADPVLDDIPVYHLTGPPHLQGRADFANIHPYPKKGNQPRATLVRALADHLALRPDDGAVITETGYYTLPGGPGWEGVDEETQAKLTLNLIFDAAELGVHRVYLYELLDVYPDPDGTRMNRHFGLFDMDYEPKPAATALHNLTRILRDDSPEAASFTPGSLAYSATGLSSTAGNLLIQKSTGAFSIVFWEEPDIWNEAADAPIAAPERPVRVALGDTFGEVRVYDPLVGTAPIKLLRDVDAVKITLADHPVIVELSDPEEQAGRRGADTPVLARE